MDDLCAAAVDAATSAGAEYADARAVVRRVQLVATKNGRVEQLTDIESEGTAFASSSTARGGSRATADSRATVQATLPHAQSPSRAQLEGTGRNRSRRFRRRAPPIEHT